MAFIVFADVQVADSSIAPADRMLDTNLNIVLYSFTCI